MCSRSEVVHRLQACLLLYSVRYPCGAHPDPAVGDKDTGLGHPLAAVSNSTRSHLANTRKVLRNVCDALQAASMPQQPQCLDELTGCFGWFGRQHDL